MRIIIGLTFAAFIAILAVAVCASENAKPEMINVDPAKVGLQR